MGISDITGHVVNKNEISCMYGRRMVDDLSNPCSVVFYLYLSWSCELTCGQTGQFLPIYFCFVFLSESATLPISRNSETG